MSIHTRAIIIHEKLEELLAYSQIVQYDRANGIIDYYDATVKLSFYRREMRKLSAELLAIQKESDHKCQT